MTALFRAADVAIVHLLAIVLLIAAFAKAASETISAYGPFPWELVAGVEAAAGIVLVLRRHSGTVRLVVGAFYLLLAGVALGTTLRGHESCHCLGEIAVAPWRMLIFDLLGGSWLLLSALVWDSPRAFALRMNGWLVAKRGTRSAAVGAAALCAGIAGTQWTAYWEEANRPLRIDPAELNLGSIWLEEEFEHRLTITNTSEREITIGAFDASCACTRIEPATMRLAPAESRSIALRINLFKVAREDWKASRWPLSIKVEARVKGEVKAAGSWLLQGEVLSPFRGYPVANVDTLSLWRTGAAGQTDFDLNLQSGITVIDSKPVTRGVACDVAKRGEQSFAVSMRIDPAKCESGLFLARAALILSDAQGKRLPMLPLEARVRVKASATLDPAVLLLQDRAPATVYIRAARDRSFRLVEIGRCTGLTVTSPATQHAYARQHTLTITPTEADPTLSIVRLFIDVRTTASPVTERLTLPIQLPTRLR